MTPQTRNADATRATILAAARDRFVADGYRNATIRAIAADANIDPAMVMRYFGSKERLFATAVEIDLRLPDPATVTRDDGGARLARFFIERWEQDDTLTALMRAGATNEATAVERVQDVFARQTVPLVAALIEDPAEAPRRAALISSQILGMAMCRYILRLPPIVAMSSEEIVGWLGPTLQRYFTAEIPREHG